MCCATTAKLNDLGEKVDYKYGEIEKGMPIYMDDISVAGGPEEVKKKNKEIRKNGNGKENEIQLKQNITYVYQNRKRKGTRYSRNK